MPIVRIEPDGTRVYTKGHRYRPPDNKRKYDRLKPDNAEERGFVHWHGQWWGPLPLLPEDERKIPWTRPDSEAVYHQLGCKCVMCRTVPRVRKLKKERLLKPAQWSRRAPGRTQGGLRSSEESD